MQWSASSKWMGAVIYCSYYHTHHRSRELHMLLVYYCKHMYAALMWNFGILPHSTAPKAFISGAIKGSSLCTFKPSATKLQCPTALPITSLLCWNINYLDLFRPSILTCLGVTRCNVAYISWHHLTVNNSPMFELLHICTDLFVCFDPIFLPGYWSCNHCTCTCIMYTNVIDKETLHMI